MMKLGEIGLWKRSKTTQIAIKRIWTKSNIRINQNQTLMDEIKNTIQLGKRQKKNK
jgi:hypothetical protein